MDMQSVDLHNWNDIQFVKPLIKDQVNDIRASDEVWILFKDGQILSHPTRYYEKENGKCYFIIKEHLISHWAYLIPPPLPSEFKPQKLER